MAAMPASSSAESRCSTGDYIVRLLVEPILSCTLIRTVEATIFTYNASDGSIGSAVTDLDFTWEVPVRCFMSEDYAVLTFKNSIRTDGSDLGLCGPRASRSIVTTMR